jgi:hypothetical protein
LKTACIVVFVCFRVGRNWPDEEYRLDFSIDPKYEVCDTGLHVYFIRQFLNVHIIF